MISRHPDPLREFGFRAPLQIGYHFDFSAFKLYAFTGPEFNLGVIGRNHYTEKSNGTKVSESENMYSTEGGFNRFDTAWRIGAGISVDNYYLSLSGSIGMLDRAKEEISWHQNVVSVTLGYNF